MGAVSTLTDLFNVHTVTVRTYLGVTPTGDGYSDPVTITGFLDDGNVLKEADTGSEVVHRSSFYCDLKHYDLFMPESVLSTARGRDLVVKGRRERDGGTLFGDVEHLEVDLA